MTEAAGRPAASPCPASLLAGLCLTAGATWPALAQTGRFETGGSLPVPIAAEAAPRSAAPRTVPGAPVGPAAAPNAPPETGAAGPAGAGILIGPVGTSEAPAADRAVTVRPRITFQTLFTDNLFNTRRDRRADLVAAVLPSVLVNADTLRVQGTLDYAPSLQLHARTSDQNRVSQYLSGAMLATLVPGRAFVDARAFALPLEVGGAAPAQGAPLASRAQQVQAYGGQLMPYVVQRFGSLATAQLGYAFRFSIQDGPDGRLPDESDRFFVAENYVANTGFAVLRSGEDFGRLALEARIERTDYAGDGVLDGARQGLASIEARYAVLRGVALLVQLGYQDLAYGGTPAVRIAEPVWAVGFRLAPSDETSVIAKYGRWDGAEAGYLNAGIALGGRTRLNASYAEQLTSTSLRTQDLLSSTRLDPLGNPIDAESRAPVTLSSALLAAQNSVSRVRRFGLALSRSMPRDTLTLAVTAERQRPVSVARGTVAFAQRGAGVSLTWVHDLAPRTQTIAFVQYGRVTSSRRGDRDVLTATAALNYRLTETATATLQYAVIRRDGDKRDDRTLRNVVLLGMTVAL